MELWDIYDAYRHKTGRTGVRGEPVLPGDYHLVVHLIVFNAAGQMLIQQRQSCKRSCPDMWDITVGGCAVVGESSQEAAMRELREEIMAMLRDNTFVPYHPSMIDMLFDLRSHGGGLTREVPPSC
jgi:hypothetical protein